MIKNYIKIAFRNLWGNKTFSSINIIGLAIGLSASFVIGAIIYYDLTFDKFHPDSERIYRVTSEFTSPEGSFYNGGVPVPLGTTLRESMAIVELTSAFFNLYLNKIENSETEKVFQNPEHLIYADQNYFELFPYQWLAGTPYNILSGPNEVVLTESRGATYFPDLPPGEMLGKILMYNDSIPVKVAGIVGDFDKRSDFIFQEFVSFKTASSLNMTDRIINDQWNSTSSGSQVFIKLVGQDKELLFQEQLDRLAKEHESEEMLSYGQNRKFYLQPLNDLHFNSNFGIFNNSGSTASKTVLVSLAFIALFLLLLGCINFINLNTANATRRAKEIGIRKTLGSSKKQLVFQFIGETFLLTIVAGIVSLFFSAWLLKIFADFVPKDLSFELFTSPIVIILIAVLLITVSLLAGFYPAMVLSHFKPVSVLKSKAVAGQNKSLLRKYLTVFQFVIAQVFIIATILVGKQINYVMTKDMGFKTEAIAYARTPWSDASIDKRMRFLKEIEALPQVSGVSLGGSPPASFNTHSSSVTYLTDEKEIHTSLELLYGDQNYLNLYDLKLLAGRKPLNDTIREFVINEAYLKMIGFNNPQDAIGQVLTLDDATYPIVAVMEDFNQRSLKSSINPMALIGDWDQDEYSQLNTVHFSLQTQNTENWPAAIAQVENIWKGIYPDSEIRLNFIDDTVKRFYEQEGKMSVLLNWATGLAILISCLGLLGLVIHTTERRTKEIGIRKVLGASLVQLNVLLCKEFMILVGIAFVIAAPIAWYGISNWLEDFAYKTSLSWWVFAFSGAAMLFISLVIMNIRTLASANVNPVKSLQTE
ncbi:MAG: cell division protein FtsX [Flavobacteriaceae bacterium]|nr:MAG: cell division protein FtsX [Flavobacteriaceae bacterium]